MCAELVVISQVEADVCDRRKQCSEKQGPQGCHWGWWWPSEMTEIRGLLGMRALEG